MRIKIRPLATLILAGIFSMQTMLSQSTVESSVLVKALPASCPEGFRKGELKINSTSPAEVNVSCFRITGKGTGSEEGVADLKVSITISIRDETGNSEFTRLMIAPERNGEKAVKVKGEFEGKESIEKNDYGCVQTIKIFLVNDRFLVEIKAVRICDMTIVDQLIEAMDLEVLPE